MDLLPLLWTGLHFEKGRMYMEESGRKVVEADECKI